MASIIKRVWPSGAVTWQAKIRRKGFPAISESFAKRSEAEAWAADKETDMRRGRFTDFRSANNLNLDAALDRYLKEVSVYKKGHQQELSRIALWKDSPLAKYAIGKIRPADVAKWRDDRLAAGAAPGTVRNDLILLSHLFTVAERNWGFESIINPVKKIQKPKMPRGRERRLVKNKHIDEEQLLITTAEKSPRPWMAPFIIIAIETAMRLSEILKICRKKTDFKKRSTHLADTKSGDARDVPLSKRAMEILKNLPVYDEDDNRFFPFTLREVEYGWKHIITATGIQNLRFHDLRHEAVSRMVEKGLSDIQVSSISGHKTLIMLKRYAHLRAQNLAELLD